MIEKKSAGKKKSRSSEKPNKTHQAGGKTGESTGLKRK